MEVYTNRFNRVSPLELHATWRAKLGDRTAAAEAVPYGNGAYLGVEIASWSKGHFTSTPGMILEVTWYATQISSLAVNLTVQNKGEPRKGSLKNAAPGTWQTTRMPIENFKERVRNGPIVPGDRITALIFYVGRQSIERGAVVRVAAVLQHVGMFRPRGESGNK